MEEIDRACQAATQMRAALEEALRTGHDMVRAMRTLASEPLLEAAARRDEIHATIERLTRELAAALAEVQRRRGWSEVTMAKLATIAPEAAGRLSQHLDAIRTRAAELRALDGRTRARGARALSWLRSLRGGDPTRVSAYDRRGQVVSDRPLTTATRTL